MTFVHNAQWTGQSQGEEEGTEWMATRVAWPRTRRGRSQRQEAAEGGGSQEEGVTQSNKSFGTRGEERFRAFLIQIPGNVSGMNPNIKKQA